MHCAFIAAILAAIAAAGTACAQGGPPFRTDDPETPGNKRWEVNFGFIGDRNPGAGVYQLPDSDINYGLGDRIQLKYEIPIALAEQRSGNAQTGGAPSGAGEPAASGATGFAAGLGESLLGVKWRFYEHRVQGHAPLRGAAPLVDFSVSTYPQLFLNNPTTSIARRVVPPGPDVLLPVEANARVGPVRLDAEIGYHFGNRALAQSWIRGLIVGHEFSERTELYLEIYDQQDANRVTDLDGERLAKQRESTVGAGGRQALNKEHSLNLLFMGGRTFQTASGANGQPTFIGYMGLQVLFGRAKAPDPDVEQKLPDEAVRMKP